MAHCTLKDLTSDWFDESAQAADIMPKPQSIRNISVLFGWSTSGSIQKVRCILHPHQLKQHRLSNKEATFGWLFCCRFFPNAQCYFTGFKFLQGVLDDGVARR